MSRWGQKIVIFFIDVDAPTEFSVPEPQRSTHTVLRQPVIHPALIFIVLTSTNTPPGAS
jgi:hypothetical protein